MRVIYKGQELELDAYEQELLASEDKVDKIALQVRLEIKLRGGNPDTVVVTGIGYEAADKVDVKNVEFRPAVTPEEIEDIKKKLLDDDRSALTVIRPMGELRTTKVMMKPGEALEIEFEGKDERAAIKFGDGMIVLVVNAARPEQEFRHYFGYYTPLHRADGQPVDVGECPWCGVSVDAEPVDIKLKGGK